MNLPGGFQYVFVKCSDPTLGFWSQPWARVSGSMLAG